MILTVGGGEIVPVRAIPCITGNAFNALSVSVAIADGRQNWEHRLFETFLHAGYIDRKGHPYPLTYADLAPQAEAVERLSKDKASSEEQIAALPAGVYIPLADLQSMVNETNDICGGPWPSGDGMAPITINATPRVSGETRAVLLQGFEAYTRGHHRRKQSKSTQVESPENPLTQRKQDRLEVQWIATEIWRSNPRMSIKAMCNHQKFAPYRRTWRGANTLSSWISKADPRRPESKPGRRYKT